MNTTALQDAAAALRAATVRKEESAARYTELENQLVDADKESREAITEFRAAHDRLIRIASDKPVGE